MHQWLIHKQPTNQPEIQITTLNSWLQQNGPHNFYVVGTSGHAGLSTLFHAEVEHWGLQQLIKI